MQRNEKTNFNYEYFLNEKYGGEPKKILDKYKYNDGGEIFDQIKKKGDNMVDLKHIVNEIVLWKVGRMVVVNDDTLQALNEITKIKSPEEAVSGKREQLTELIEKLLDSKGVKLPMASTFLHFFNPDVFPIIDQRAYRVIYKKDYKDCHKTKDKVKTYLDYLQGCIEYYNKNLKDSDIAFSRIDQYLYQLDKEIGNRIKM